MPGTVVVHLSVRRPFSSAPLLRVLQAHAIEGLESSDLAARSHTKALTGPSGRPALVTVTFDDAGARVVAEVRTADSGDLDAIAATVGRWLDLDADPVQIDGVLGRDELLAPLVAARPGLRVLGSTDGFETAVATVLGQQVSLAAARTFGARLVAAYGRPGLEGSMSFPTAETLAATDPHVLGRVVGLTGARGRTVHALATAAADGLVLDPAGDHNETRARLRALPGIGPWTVEYLAVRVLRDRDAFPAEDLVLRRALGGASRRETMAMAERWRPWRAYALTHLWTREAFL